MKQVIRNFFVGFFIVGLMTACAATAQAVPPGTNWSGILSGILVLLIVCTVAGYFIYKKMHPTAAPSPAPDPSAGADVPILRTAVLSPDAQVIANSIGELLGHLKDQAAATAAKDAPRGCEGVAGVFSCKVTGQAKSDIPTLTAAYFNQGVTAAARRPK